MQNPFAFYEGHVVCGLHDCLEPKPPPQPPGPGFFLEEGGSGWDSPKGVGDGGGVGLAGGWVRSGVGGWGGPLFLPTPPPPGREPLGSGFMVAAPGLQFAGHTSLPGGRILRGDHSGRRKGRPIFFMGSQLPWGERSQWGNKKNTKGKKQALTGKKWMSP